LCMLNECMQNYVPMLISLLKGLHWVKDELILSPSRLS
jgi:hypothetical protein